jgi:transcriptional regulator with XRE-family HTH domain
MNRTELAKEIGIAPSTINSWYNRNCDNISLSTLIKLSKYFNISMEELINGDPSQTVIFNEFEYTKSELKIIRKFGDFIKENRQEKQMPIILPFSELEKRAGRKRRKNNE